MTGESNLSILLRSMEPVLHADTFGFFSLPEPQALPLLSQSQGFFHESEGWTLILSATIAEKHSLELGQPWALVTLNIHSSLLAVGFLSSISSALAAAGISLNAISAYYHDHLFVPWHLRNQACTVLNDLINAQPSA